MMDILDIVQGVINYPNTFRKLVEVNINVKQNDCCIIVGKNGSGKSTFFDTLCGFRNFYSTKNYFKGYEAIGYCVQDFNGGLFPWLTVQQNIYKPMQLINKSTLNSQQVESYLGKFKLMEKKEKFPYQLSGGQKQLINIIRTLCTPSNFLVFDEPFSALHTDNKNIAIEAMNKIQKTKLIITHSVSDINDINANRFFIINHTIFETDKESLIKYLDNE